jgi:hypothetical protein
MRLCASAPAALNAAPCNPRAPILRSGLPDSCAIRPSGIAPAPAAMPASVPEKCCLAPIILSTAWARRSVPPVIPAPSAALAAASGTPTPVAAVATSPACGSNDKRPPPILIPVPAARPIFGAHPVGCAGAGCGLWYPAATCSMALMLFCIAWSVKGVEERAGIGNPGGGGTSESCEGSISLAPEEGAACSWEGSIS